MDNINLNQNQIGFKWIKAENFYFKGYIFDLNERLYSGEELADYFTGIKSYSDFEERVSYANGCFSVIYQKEELLYAACDIIRSFPLFYKRLNGEWIISDNAYFLLGKNGNDEINELASKEFLATGYVTGDETLVTGIHQVQAGEIIRFEDEELKKKFYFTYRISATNDYEYIELKSDGIEIFNNSFKRFIASLNGRTVVIPLSGGYDSRLIAVMLKKYEYEKVVCFTYGRPGNPEIEISGKVAEILGFKWINIEYSDELIRNYLNDNVFRDYYKYSGNLVSMFFMQEYFAVKYLKDHNLIPDESIFAPGHSGDFLGGSQLNKHGNLGLYENIWDLTNGIYYVKYCYLRPKSVDKERILKRIQKTLEEKFTGNSDLSYSIHEDWDFKEKLAKFNFNSSTIYTFFGYEFRFPFWDREIVNFFKILPIQVKINKYLYNDILCNEFFEPFGLNFENELQVSDSVLKWQRVKNRIKYLLPNFLLRFFMTKLDNLYYNEITQVMIDDLALKGKKIRVHGNFFNSLIIQWYMEETRRRVEGGEEK
jgi:asparagine synthase (glutamine-hydrolysing)